MLARPDSTATSEISLKSGMSNHRTFLLSSLVVASYITALLAFAKVRVVCMLIRPLLNKGDHSNPRGSDKIYFTLSTYVLCIWDFSLSRGHVLEILLINDTWIKKSSKQKLWHMAKVKQHGWSSHSKPFIWIACLFSLGFHWLIKATSLFLTAFTDIL